MPAREPKASAGPPVHLLSAPWQRPLDIVLTLVFLPAALPLIALLALAVRLDSPGSAIFRQERLGVNGRRFWLFKLRSMRAEADEGEHRRRVDELLRPAGKGRPWLPPAEDPRVTRLGRFLRQSGLDELPQLFNVLRGEMSLVGPRPALPYEAERWAAWHRRRLGVRPGLTGLWQVTGRDPADRSPVDFDGMVRLDLDYIGRRSLALDLWILGMTPVAIWRRRRRARRGAALSGR